MILQALKEYYDRKAADPDSDIAPPGWERKEIPFLIVLNASGDIVSIEDTREPIGKKKRAKTFLVPQSVKRTVGVDANFLWDNVEYALGVTCKGKDERVLQQHQAFQQRLRDHATIPAIAVILNFLNRTDKETCLEKFSDIWAEMKESCSFLTFKIANALPVFDDPAIRTVVGETSSTTQTGTCLISGENDVLEALHPAIKGVQGCNTVGGNIVSFNFDASTSFNKKQGLNAPICKLAAFAYTTALNTLLGKDSKQKIRIGDATTIFWSEKKSAFEDDFSNFFDEPPKDNPDQLTNAVAALYSSVESGSAVFGSENNRFYVLGLSPNAARISVRFWHVATVSELSARFREYFEDMRIVHGLKDQDHLSLWRLLVSTAALGKSENISPNLAGNVMRSILEGLPFPETLLQAAVLRVKAEREVSYARAKLIKGCLNRKFRINSQTNTRSLTVSLDKENTDIGYRLGRLFATLEKIQQEANPGINATIRDKFYASASSVPRTVFGNLMRLKNHHLSKLENAGRRVNFEKLLGEIISEIPPAFPAHLNLDEQGKFAVGYYHQVQFFFTKKSSDETSATNA